MDTRDLRRGNLILTSKDKDGKRFLRAIVEEIKANAVVVRGERVVRIEDCEGIRLTEEWLNILGLKAVYSGGYEVPNTGFDCLLRLDFDSAKAEAHLFVTVINGNEGSEDVVVSETFQFVHQLQNICRDLTGEDLKVNGTEIINSSDSLSFNPEWAK